MGDLMANGREYIVTEPEDDTVKIEELAEVAEIFAGVRSAIVAQMQAHARSIAASLEADATREAKEAGRMAVDDTARNVVQFVINVDVERPDCRHDEMMLLAKDVRRARLVELERENADLQSKLADVEARERAAVERADRLARTVETALDMAGAGVSS